MPPPSLPRQAYQGWAWCAQAASWRLGDGSQPQRFCSTLPDARAGLLPTYECARTRRDDTAACTGAVAHEPHTGSTRQHAHCPQQLKVKKTSAEMFRRIHHAFSS
eukprot:1058355-Pleurochrysis_carterae.AAC.1